MSRLLLSTYLLHPPLIDDIEIIPLIGNRCVSRERRQDKRGVKCKVSLPESIMICRYELLIGLGANVDWNETMNTWRMNMKVRDT